jgi:hypothetical protein
MLCVCAAATNPCKTTLSISLLLPRDGRTITLWNRCVSEQLGVTNKSCLTSVAIRKPLAFSLRYDNLRDRAVMQPAAAA